MIAKVLYSHESKFKAPDDSEVCGYQTGVLYNDQFGKDRFRKSVVSIRSAGKRLM